MSSNVQTALMVLSVSGATILNVSASIQGMAHLDVFICVRRSNQDA